MHIYEKLDDGMIKSRHFTSYANPRYEGNNEILRPSTLGDLKKWRKQGKNVSPSVTTILDVYAKHALVDWKINQHLEIAYDKGLDLLKEPSVISFQKEVKRLTELQMDIAPSAGTDFHKSMEIYIDDALDVNHPHIKLCESVADLIKEKTKADIRLWQPEINIFSDLGYSGQCDLYIPAVYDSGHQYQEAWIIDYKTKQFAKQWRDKNGKKKKLAYGDSHCAQLAAYGMELEPTGKFRAANVFVCLETGEVEFYEWSSEEIIKWFEYFQLAVQAWEIKNL